MFVIQSCQKIEYNVLFMMIFIPVSNFGDQSLESVWNPSGPSDSPTPQTSNWSGTIFCRFVKQAGSNGPVP